jgi:hypothetical protein
VRGFLDDKLPYAPRPLMVVPPDHELPGRLRAAAAVIRDIETSALMRIAANRIGTLARDRTGEPLMPVETHKNIVEKLKAQIREQTYRADRAERAIRDVTADRDFWRIRAKQAGDQAA